MSNRQAPNGARGAVPPPTPEQSAIIAAAKTPANLMVTAYAGCAKTTTLCMIAKALPPTPALALAFNVKIKKELAERFPSHFEILTFNGLGHRAWQAAIGKRLTVDQNKLERLVTAATRPANASQDDWIAVRNLVRAAMQNGLVPEPFGKPSLIPDAPDTWAQLAQAHWIEPTQLVLALAREVLCTSIRESFSGTVSFDDQVYCSAMLGGLFPRFPLVMVDEAQDLSPLNHIQVRKVASKRLIVVGDPKQAIYGFRGADSESMNKLRVLRQEWTDLPLTLTFRCPHILVTRQQKHAPGFTAAPANAPGTVHDWQPTESALATWDHSKLLDIDSAPAVLCRNNAPLMKLAFKLLRRRVSCTMLGRDIGKGLIALLKKLVKDDWTLSAAQVASLADAWIVHESQLAVANGHEERVESIEDRGQCLLAVMESLEPGSNAGHLRQALETLFAAETGRVTLASGHRAKGLEWNTVVHLDPWRIPSRHAKQAFARGNLYPMEQELNLRYVIETRARQTLVLANIEQFQ